MMLFEEFSGDDEGVEGYYRAGLCYQKMGYTGKAEQIFSDITANYPQSHIAETALTQKNLDSFLMNTQSQPTVQIQPQPEQQSQSQSKENMQP
jgi:hypothetical protein